MAFQKKATTAAKKEVYSEDVQPEHPRDIILKDGTLARGGASIMLVDNDINKEYLDELAFMEEELTVMVQETSDENAENPVMVGNNGIYKEFYRGRVTTAKRKFIDGLIVKTSRVKTDKVKTSNGEDTFAIRQHSAHKYPFSVIHDPNPRGKDWLMKRLSDAI